MEADVPVDDFIVKVSVLPVLILAPIVIVSASREILPSCVIATLVAISPPPSPSLSAFIVTAPVAELLTAVVLIVITPSAAISTAPAPETDNSLIVKLPSFEISITPVDDSSALVTAVSIETAPSALITKLAAVILLVPAEIVPSAINQISPPAFTDIGADIDKSVPPVNDSPVIEEKEDRPVILVIEVALVDRSKSVTPPKLAPVLTVMPFGLTNIRFTLSLALTAPANVEGVSPVILFNTTDPSP